MLTTRRKIARRALPWSLALLCFVCAGALMAGDGAAPEGGESVGTLIAKFFGTASAAGLASLLMTKKANKDDGAALYQNIDRRLTQHEGNVSSDIRELRSGLRELTGRVETIEDSGPWNRPKV